MTVYLDLPCGGVHLYGNVFFDNQRAFFTNSGRDCLIENNIFVRCEPSVYFNSWRDRKLFEKGGAWRMVERLTDGIAYDQPPYSTRYPELLRLFQDRDIRIPTGNVVRGNVSTGGQFLGLHPEVNFDDVKVERNLIGDRTLFTGSPSGNGKSGLYSQGDPVLTPLWEKAGNVFREGDPGFVDATRQDFRLKPDSPAWKLGFKPIPFDQIGLHKDPYRTALPLPPPIIVSASRFFVDELAVELLLPARSPDAVVRYTLDGSEPIPASSDYRKPVILNQTTTLRAAAFLPDGSAASRVVEATFTGARLADGIYLSSLPAVDVRAHAGLKQDANYSGGTIVLNGRAYERGILLCPEATQPGYAGGKGQVTYVLDGGLERASRFRAVVGIEDQVKDDGRPSVTFAVDVRRHGAWQCIFETPVLRWGQTREVDLDISAADQLRLRTTDAGDTIHADHAVWADAKLR